MNITIEKAYDGNVLETENWANGRITTREVGWRWIVLNDGQTVEDFERLWEAEHFIRQTFGEACVPKRTRAAKVAR